MTRWAAMALLLTLSFASAGCDRPRFNAGEGCSFNTDCAFPLVCGLERCRRQCADSRDCAAGLLCLRLPTGDVCQLPDERRCSLTSECSAGLACRFGTCTTACVENRDCPDGASCAHDPEQNAMACIEDITALCIWNSDCPEGMVCGHDQVCRIECYDDFDCDLLRYCADNGRCMPRADAGP